MLCAILRIGSGRFMPFWGATAERIIRPPIGSVLWLWPYRTTSEWRHACDAVGAPSSEWVPERAARSGARLQWQGRRDDRRKRRRYHSSDTRDRSSSRSSFRGRRSPSDSTKKGAGVRTNGDRPVHRTSPAKMAKLTDGKTFTTRRSGRPRADAATPRQERKPIP